MPSQGGGQHQHRAGALRQSNKKNKRSKSSKRSLSRAAGGRVESNTKTSRSVGQGALRIAEQCKANRRNTQQQLRNAKRQAVLQQKRGIVVSVSNTATSTAGAGAKLSCHHPTSLPVPPRVVGILSVGASHDIEQQLRDFLVKQANDVVHTDALYPDASATCHFKVHKKDGYVTLLTCQSSCLGKDKINDDDAAIWAALDLARICDLLLFVIDGDGPRLKDTIKEIHIASSASGAAASISTHKSKRTQGTNNTQQQQQQQQWDHLISSRGDRILAAIKAQGLPTPLTVLAHTIPDPNDDDDNVIDNDHMTMQSMKSIRRSRVKRQQDLKKYVGRFATTEFGSGNDKVVEINLFERNETNDGDSINQQNSNADKIDDDEHVDAGADDVDNEMDGISCATAGMSSGVALSSHHQRSIAVAAAALVRTVCNMACMPSQWVAQTPRARILSDSYRYDGIQKQLQLTGFVRGMAPWDVNALLHIPGLGTFSCESIQRAIHPLAKKRLVVKRLDEARKDSETMQAIDLDEQYDSDETILPDPELQESLDMFAVPDSLQGEQNLIGFNEPDEVNDQDEGVGNTISVGDKSNFARPAGWSDYQSAWLDAVNDEEDGEGEDEDGGAKDHGELATALNTKSSATTRGDGVSVLGTDGMMDLDDADPATAQERNALLEQRRKDQSEHREFPDEVQIDEDANARDRFARYRSLKSFQKSFWDPKENLPDSYAAIFNFSSFKATQRSVMKEMKELMRAAERAQGHFWGCTLGITTVDKSGDAPMEAHSEGNDDTTDEDDDILAGCVPSGSYVQLTVKGVPADVLESVACGTVLTAVTLLPHENKVSVLHMGLCHSSACDVPHSQVPVKSKDVLTFRCGWRTWQCRPVFSQHNLTCDKHKFERYLPPTGAFFVASTFGPVTYTPCPVMAFRWNETIRRREMVATGSFMSADSDRIVVKRIVLTGFPVRVHKRSATVKYMFYNPDDVKWFRPAGLYTKHGLQGNIIESVGEHGTMKCLFNAPIKQHDTVCLPLYKRIYPKFAPSIQEGKSVGSRSEADEGMTTRTPIRPALIVR